MCRKGQNIKLQQWSREIRVEIIEQLQDDLERLSGVDVAYFCVAQLE